jgi:hypothetical protein
LSNEKNIDKNINERKAGEERHRKKRAEGTRERRNNLIAT